MQAAATAMIESYCDEVNTALKESFEKKGLYLRPRFSPGYGDFPLECQRDITSVLETAKRIGIMLTDSLLMTPSKSVTAVMGVSPKPHRCEVRGCELCSKTDCAYRLALLRGFLFCYCDVWALGSDMEVRPHNSLYLSLIHILKNYNGRVILLFRC